MAELKTITVQANQSMADVVLMATGTLEAVMAFCRYNNVSVSHAPAPGEVYVIPEGIVTDAAELKKIADEGAQIGNANLGVCGLPALEIVDKTYNTISCTIGAGTGAVALEWAAVPFDDYGEPAPPPDSGTLADVGDTDLEITGLAAETHYTVYLRTRCWGNVSAWVSDSVFTLEAPTLDALIVLRPVERGQVSVSLPYYTAALLKEPADFVNVYNLETNYPTTNKASWMSMDDYIATGGAGAPVLSSASITQSLGLASYQTTDAPDAGETRLYWNDLTADIRTITFTDVKGNKAEYSPVMVVDEGYTTAKLLLPDVTIEVLSATADLLTLRLEKTHAMIDTPNINLVGMNWFGDVVGGTPDPDDPTNPNKMVINLIAGSYELGARASYMSDDGLTTWPSSRRSMVIEVA